MPLQPYTGAWNRKTAAHLLRRATFGFSKPKLDEFTALGLNGAINRLFTPPASLLSDSPLNLAGEEFMLDPSIEAGENENFESFFLGWLMGRMRQDTDSVQEKLAFFMHTFFTCMKSRVSSRAMYFQNELFRQFVFDQADPLKNFKELTKKICVDNAMLRFLDARLSVKGNPNENFARELLELYSIGRGYEGDDLGDLAAGDYFYFTEDDIDAAARVFTGLDDLDDAEYADAAYQDPDTGLPRGKAKGNGTIANQHDNDPKTFTAAFNNTTITPDPALLDGGEATFASILDEIDQLIEIIYAQDETARHICRRLYRFYVYHDITPEINNTIITEMADTLRSSGYKIEAVLRELFRSQHFYDAAAGVGDNKFGGIIKSPLDLAIGTLRFFEYQLPDYQTNREVFYSMMAGLRRKMEKHDFNLYEPFEVAGYYAYHQFPLYDRNWIGANTLANRYKFIEELLPAAPMMAEPEEIAIDVLSFTQQRFAAEAPNPTTLVEAVALYLFTLTQRGAATDPNTEITNERYNYFELAMLANVPTADPLMWWNFNWTNATDDARALALVPLYNSMLQSPEYQLS